MNFFTICRFNGRGRVEVEDIDDPEDKVSFEGVRTFREYDALTAKISRSGEWADCLNAYPVSSPLVVSQRVVDGFDNAGIKGVKFVPVNFNILKRRFDMPSDYYCLLPSGKALEYRRLYLKKSEPGKKDIVVCELEEGVKVSEKFDYWVRIPLRETWDGSDILPFHEHLYLGSDGAVVCTRRVVELIRDARWTNFSASPVDVLSPATSELSVAPWPPESWYDIEYPNQI